MNQTIASTVNPIQINGSRTYPGDVHASTIRIAGYGCFKGKIVASSFNSSGSCVLHEQCIVETDIRMRGHAQVQAVTAKTIQTSGSFIAKEAINAEHFKARGIVIVKEKLTAEQIQMKLQSKCQINHLEAKNTVELRPDRYSLWNLLKARGKIAVCGRIDGSNIELERVEATLVIGEDIRIGPRCTIREVRYSKSLTIHPSSVVYHTVKI